MIFLIDEEFVERNPDFEKDLGTYAFCLNGSYFYGYKTYQDAKVSYIYATN